MNAKTYSTEMSFRPSVAEGFFVRIFLSFRSCLNIFNANNLRIRKGLLPPPQILYINKLSEIVTSLCRAAYEVLFVLVCRLCHFYAPTNQETFKNMDEMNWIRKITLTGLLLLFVLLPLAAQVEEQARKETEQQRTLGPSAGWYAVTRHLHIGIYTDITWLSGEPLDGTPERLHKANYIWESLRLGWRFGKQGKEASK